MKIVNKVNFSIVQKEIGQKFADVGNAIFVQKLANIREKAAYEIVWYLCWPSARSLSGFPVSHYRMVRQWYIDSGICIILREYSQTTETT